MTLYKATRLDGTDFRTGTIDYAAACGTGQPVTFPGTGPMRKDDPSTYLSLSSEPAQVLTGGRWPCRLFEAEAAGQIMSHSSMAFKVCCRQVVVVRELPAHLALGPNGQAVEALIARAGKLTVQECRDVDAAWDAAWDAVRDAAWDAAWAAARGAAGDAARAAARAAAWDAAWDAVRDAAWDAVRDAAWDAVRDAVRALVVRDLISAEHFDALYGPWASVIEGKSS